MSGEFGREHVGFQTFGYDGCFGLGYLFLGASLQGYSGRYQAFERFGRLGGV